MKDMTPNEAWQKIEANGGTYPSLLHKEKNSWTVSTKLKGSDWRHFGHGKNLREAYEDLANKMEWIEK